MKTVFKTHEIFHLWANGGAEFGRSPSAVSFQGDILRSYSTDIGRIIRFKDGRQTVALLNATSYSVTTSAHQSAMRQAARHRLCIYVDGLERGDVLRRMTPEDIRNNIIDRAVEKFAQAARSTKANKESRKESAFALLVQADEVAKLFRLRRKPAADQKAKFEKKGEALAKEQLIALRKSNHIAACQADRRLLWSAERIASSLNLPVHPDYVSAVNVLERISPELRQWADDMTAKENFSRRVQGVRNHAERLAVPCPADFTEETLAAFRETLQAEQKKADALRAIQLEAELKDQLDAWQAGTGHHSWGFNQVTVRLRLVEEAGRLTVETSHGASVLLRQALRLFAYCKALKTRSQTFQNIAQGFIQARAYKVGPYELRSIDKDGNAEVGCHFLPFAEMERLYNTLTPAQIAQETEAAEVLTP